MGKRKESPPYKSATKIEIFIATINCVNEDKASFVKESDIIKETHCFDI